MEVEVEGEGDSVQILGVQRKDGRSMAHHLREGERQCEREICGDRTRQRVFTTMGLRCRHSIFLSQSEASTDIQ